MKQAQKGGEKRNKKESILAEALGATGVDESKMSAALTMVEKTEEAVDSGVLSANNVGELFKDLSTKDAEQFSQTADIIETTNDAVTSGFMSADKAGSFLADSSDSDAATIKAKTDALNATSAAVRSGALDLADADSLLTNMSKSSAADLLASSSVIESATTSFASGEVSAADLKNLSTNIAAVAKTAAAATASGGSLGEDFNKNLIRNSDKAADIGNTDFSDPNAALMVSLKAEFPSFSAFIDSNKDDPQGVSSLLTELKNLNLTTDELSVLLSDLQQGPQATVPGTPPATVTPLSLQNEVAMLSLLEDVSIEGKIDATVFMAGEKALASVFFQDLASAYDALSDLDKASHLSDSVSSGVDPEDVKEMVLGGKKISIANGTYSLGESSTPYDYLIAATDKLTLLGNVVFNPASADSVLLLLSAQNIDFTGTSSITFSGDELGMGSFDSMNVENVDLKAEGTISLRSLDSIVLKNSKMETSGKGADFVHLLAANQITADSVQFSAMVQKITMEAMTINLSNINFPSGSNVNLNSLYGGLAGKYPNFGAATQYGRVNFIKSMSYGSNAVMDRTAFDTHGGNIKIGIVGK
jgi:hypothetical protein